MTSKNELILIREDTTLMVVIRRTFNNAVTVIQLIVFLPTELVM